MKRSSTHITVRYVILMLALSVLTSVTVITRDLGNPINFNHKLHLTQIGMDCKDCHQYVMDNRKATLPDRRVCVECHSDAQGTSPEEQKLVATLQSGEELRWNRVYVLPKHVYFSHFRHVTLGQIGCQNCHGEMNQLTSPPIKPAVRVIDMSYCTDCHNEKRVSNDCLTCHI